MEPQTPLTDTATETETETETAKNSPTDGYSDDEVLVPFSSFVEELAQCGDQLSDPTTGLVMSIESVKLDLPVEIGISVDDSGRVRVTGAPPTQRTETTFLPVFHQLQLRVVRDSGGDESPW